MNKIFLSIDIDFWRTAEVMKPTLGNIIRYALVRKIPVTSIMNHQQIIRFTNVSDARTLVNIDEHSDLHGGTVKTLHCGNWASHVNWRQKGKYLWMRSYNKLSGNCNVFTKWDGGVDWKKAETKYVNQRYPFKEFMTDRLDAVCICLSPDYSNLDVYDAVKDMITEYDIPYTRGRMNENYSVYRYPTVVP